MPKWIEEVSLTPKVHLSTATSMAVCLINARPVAVDFKIQQLLGLLSGCRQVRSGSGIHLSEVYAHESMAIGGTGSLALVSWSPSLVSNVPVASDFMWE